MRGTSWLAEKVLASQEDLCSMGLVTLRVDIANRQRHQSIRVRHMPVSQGTACVYLQVQSICFKPAAISSHQFAPISSSINKRLYTKQSALALCLNVVSRLQFQTNWGFTFNRIIIFIIRLPLVTVLKNHVAVQWVEVGQPWYRVAWLILIFAYWPQTVGLLFFVFYKRMNIKLVCETSQLSMIIFQIT
jgi:hypothetical protein